MEQRANQVVRPKRTVALFVTALPLLGIAAGYAIDQWLWPHVLEWAKDPAVSQADSAVRIALLIAGMLAMMVSLAVVCAAWFWTMALRTHRRREFPPPGFPVLVTTALVQGDLSARHTRLLLLAGILSVAICAYVIWSMFSIFPLATALRAISG